MSLEDRRPFGGLRWRIPPRVLDVVIVLIFGIIAVAASLLAKAPKGRDDLRWVAVVLSLASVVPLWWRRSRPALALLLCWAATIAYLVLDLPENVAGTTVLVAVYSIAAYGRGRESMLGGASSVALMAALTSLGVLTGEPKQDWANVVASSVIMAAVWLIGENVHVRRLRAVELEERAHQLERQAELEAARAASKERARIARELHDVVAHSVSTIVVQAGGARRVLDAEPSEAAHALEVIETTGRDALAELRRVLGVLRTDGGRADGDGDGHLEPQPGLARLDDLVGAVREAGLQVEVQTQGKPYPLPAAVDLSAYRIVQEALTNVLKHAGDARARVVLRYARHWLSVVVLDDGMGAAAGLREHGGGHGIAGMRERASLLGGALVARARRGGGWMVHARLPVAERS
jgi:signal transduction histidine kinase